MASRSSGRAPPYRAAGSQNPQLRGHVRVCVPYRDTNGHRLFSQISMSWRGRPLESHEVVVNLIAGTTTRAGLTVHAELDEGTYPKGIKVPDKEMRQLETNHITRHTFQEQWNYTINPTKPP